MENKEINMPVSSLSYSALSQLLSNPLIFKMKYILGVYSTRSSFSSMIGKAGHEALQAYYGGHPDYPMDKTMPGAQEEAKQVGLNYLDGYGDSGIDYGKTQNRESMLKAYTQAMDFYFAEEPDYHEILFVEEKMTAEITTLDGQKLPLPASGKPDLVHRRKDRGVEIIDTKFVANFTDYDTEDYIKILQSQFMFHLLKDAKGIIADRMVFREIKRTLNSKENAGKPQVRDWVIPFDHEPYRVMFYNLYRDAVKFLSNPDAIYLPNFSDMFDGEQAGLMYTQGLISGDMSDVEVVHKVRDVALTSKKFITSRLDRAENQTLLPEEKIKLRLAEFGIPVEPIETKNGDSVTQYRFKVSAGIRMSTIKKHKDDIARALEAKGNIRILAPIPGTAFVGVEVENERHDSKALSIEHFVPGTLSLPIGTEVSGEVMKVALDDMPHLLVAGTTGSGKSVLLHNFITALTKQMTPEEMSLVLIDPKRVEMAEFASIPHLEGGKIVYEYEEAQKVLAGLTDTMEARYKLLQKARVRDIREYNEKHGSSKNMNYVVVIIDEFADLILFGKRPTKKTEQTDVPVIDTEMSIIRLAQMARAVGIHLIISTQRPSVDVITGLIKANFPTRIALTTASPTDSKIILGSVGAEKLSGKGDMIFLYPGARGEVRLQGFDRVETKPKKSKKHGKTLN